MTNPRHKIYIFENTYQMSNYLTGSWLRWAKEAIAKNQRFTAALSGGRTPIEFYSKLSSLDQFEIWQKTFLFLTDERFVPDNHPENNGKLIRDYLTNSVPIPEENCFPIPTNIDSADNAALYYEGMLEEFFKLPVGGFPSFDLILLGIGEDGHTASLFPDQLALKETQQLVIASSIENQMFDRVSLSLPVINQSRNIVFIVSGKHKAAIVKSILDGNQRYPAAHVAPENGQLFFFLDAAAAKQIRIENHYYHDGDALIIEQ